MMTEEHIKEAISTRYIELIAAFNGYTTSSPQPDYGVDLEVKEVDFRIENGRKVYTSTLRELKLQLKSTTTKTIEEDDTSIKYDLDATTFNTLIELKDKARPLILIVFILPIDKNEWIHISDSELIVRKCAYWYFPEDETKTTNTRTIRINISKQNTITSQSLNQLFEQHA